MTPGDRRPEDLPRRSARGRPWPFRRSGLQSLREARDAFERAYILGELRAHEWNITRTAQALGIGRVNLWRKLKAYGIAAPGRARTPPPGPMPETRWPAALGRRGIVASPHPLATVAGLEVLLSGGTAVDAAVAVGATLAVVYPHMTGLGGDSFWLCWDARAARLSALQAAGAAAARATPELYRGHGLAAIPTRGPLAALTVPGAPDGLFAAHRFSQEHLGSSIPWGDLLQAAIRHAADGIPVSPCQARVTASATDLLLAEKCASPRSGRPTSLGGAGAGRRLAQPRLARTLERLARGGGRAFYEGELAAEIGRACEAVGSRSARRTSPATAPLGRAGHRALPGGVAASVLPPSQGLVALAVLGILEGTDVRACAGEPADYIHLAVEATKLAFGDRDRWLADPERVAVPLGRLLDPAYLRDRGRRIAMDRAAPGPAASGVEGGDTIACVTADAAGNCVSLIQSLYHEWGSGVLAGETGVVLQNRGAGFTLTPPIRTRSPRQAALPHAHALHVPRRRQADPRRGTMGGEGQPQTLVALATRSWTSASTSRPPSKRPAGSTAGPGGAHPALSIEGRFGDAVAGDLTRARARRAGPRALERHGGARPGAPARARRAPRRGGDPRADTALGC